MGRFRRNLESVFSIDPDFSTWLLQETPNTVAAPLPDGKVLHWNRAAQHSAEGKNTLPPMPVLADETIGRILVIGGTPANRDFARTTFQSSGYKVILAESVNRAVTLTEETLPDLVLCDLHMQPLNGLDFLEIAKRTPALKHVPLVIISSTCTPERERRECLEHGAVRFLPRPIPPEALLAEITEALNTSRRGADHENPNC